MSSEILIPAPSSLLTTRQHVRNHCPALAVLHDDATILRCILQASEAIEQVFRRQFAEERLREQVVEHGAGIWLSRRPVTIIYGIIFEGMVIPDYTLLDADAGFLQASQGWSLASWHRHTQTEHGTRLTVTYTGGYRLPGWDPPVTLPEAYEMLCLLIVEVLLPLDPAQWSHVLRHGLPDTPAIRRHLADHAILTVRHWGDTPYAYREGEP